jgi:hypothetical protein
MTPAVPADAAVTAVQGAETPAPLPSLTAEAHAAATPPTAAEPLIAAAPQPLQPQQPVAALPPLPVPPPMPPTVTPVAPAAAPSPSYTYHQKHNGACRDPFCSGKPLCEEEGEESDSECEGGVSHQAKKIEGGFPLSLARLQKTHKFWWEEMSIEKECDRCKYDKKKQVVRPIVMVGTGDGKEQLWVCRCLFCGFKEEVDNNGKAPATKVGNTQTTEKDFEWAERGLFMSSMRNTGRQKWA